MTRLRRCLRRLNDGSAAMVSALIVPLIAVFLAVGFNMAIDFADKRRYQAVADVAALRLIEQGKYDRETVIAMLAAQGLRTDDIEVTVERGDYQEDTAINPNNRFTPNGTTGSSAVRVTMRLPIRETVMSGLVDNPGYFTVSATATIRGTAQISVGSRILRLEGGLSAALLDSLLGSGARLSVMDYDQLAGADIDLLTLLTELNTDLDLQAASYDDILQDSVGLADLIDAMQDSTVGEEGIPAITPSTLVGDQELMLGEFIDLGQVGLYAPGVRPGVPITANAADFLGASAVLANGENQVAVGLSILPNLLGLGEVNLTIGEPEKVLTLDYSHDPQKVVETSQTKLDVVLLSGLGVLSAVELGVDLASAEVRVDKVVCNANRQVTRVDLAVATSPAKAVIDPPLLMPIRLNLSDSEDTILSFSAQEISDRVIKPAHSGLGIDVNGQKLLLRPLMGAVDSLLQTLGLYLGEADVGVASATCSRPFLVH